MSTYSELLKHPKWQEKRLRILERDEFKCSECGSGENTLHVHHGYYERGKKPWEYDDGTLRALCEHCHEVAQERLTMLHRIIGVLDPEDLDRLRGYAAGLEMSGFGNAVCRVESLQMAVGIADAWNIPDERHPMTTLQFPSPVDGWMLVRMLNGEAPGTPGPA